MALYSDYCTNYSDTKNTDHAAMTESSTQTHAEGEDDSEGAVSSHDNCSCLLSHYIHFPLQS